MGKSKLIERFLKLRDDAQIVDEVWDCDILSICATQIQDYISYYKPNERLGLSEELINAYHQPKRLKDLLHEDFEYLISCNPELNALRDRVFIEETNEVIPSVSVIFSDTDEYLILFNKSILDLIHFFYTLCDLQCERVFTIPKYDEIIAGMDDTDLNLSWILVNKIRNLYKQKDNKLDQELNFTYYYEPFSYCEKVIAARRFLLAHELAHIYLKHHKEIPKQFGNEFSFDRYNRMQEYSADVYGIYFLLNKFDNLQSLTFSQFCNLENHLSGITQVFQLLDLVEGFYRWYKELPNHPKAFFREIESYFNLYDAIKEKYNGNELLRGYLNVASMENQLVKRVPFNIVIQELGVAGAALYHKSNLDQTDLTKGLNMPPKLRDLVNFLIEYEPFNLTKFENLEPFEEEGLLSLNRTTLGPELGEIATNNLLNGDVRPFEYDTVEWNTLIHNRRTWLNYLIELRKDDNNFKS